MRIETGARYPVCALNAQRFYGIYDTTADSPVSWAMRLRLTNRYADHRKTAAGVSDTTCLNELLEYIR